MGENDTTTIRIKLDTWQELHDRKGTGDTHDDVIQWLLEHVDDTERRAEIG